LNNHGYLYNFQLPQRAVGPEPGGGAGEERGDPGG